jgi:hypothetical protein
MRDAIGISSEAHLKEIESRLREIEGRLLDASSQTARFGLFSPEIDAKLRSVRDLLAAIHAHHGHRGWIGD